MTLTEELREADFLRDLPEPMLEQLALVTEVIELEADTVLFHEGGYSERSYVVLRGEVMLEVLPPHRGPVQVQVVGPGELLGWSPLLGMGPFTASGFTWTRCRLAALDIDGVLKLCDEDPRFGYQLMRQLARALAERLRAARQHLYSIYYRGTLVPPTPYRRDTPETRSGLAPPVYPERIRRAEYP
jgi:CRP-like cAMP-binding protein